MEGREISIVIRYSNVEEKFVRIAGIPQNRDLGIVQACLRESLEQLLLYVGSVIVPSRVTLLCTLHLILG